MFMASCFKNYKTNTIIRLIHSFCVFSNEMQRQNFISFDFISKSQSTKIILLIISIKREFTADKKRTTVSVLI